MYIGIIYCLPQNIASEREFEQLADLEVLVTARSVQAGLEKNNHQVELVNLTAKGIKALKKYDWVFNLTESVYGFPLEEYDIAAQMEKYGIPFTGAGSVGLRECIDKAFTKSKLQKIGIRTPSFEVFQRDSTITSNLSYPLIVKPVHEDGSIGITENSIVNNQDDLAEKVIRIHAVYDQAALVEEYIEGIDITASMIGNGAGLTVLPLSENVYSGYDGAKILTYEAKWIVESRPYRQIIGHCPSEIDPEAQTEIKTTAVKAFNTMQCHDYARVDFRFDGSKAYVLEVNPNPCIYPDQYGLVGSAMVAGINYDALVNKILDCSIERWNAVKSYKNRGPVYENHSQKLRTGRQTGYRNNVIPD